jgi:aminopeptidase-like protein
VGTQQADGTNSLLDIARRARLPFTIVRAAAQSLADAGLIADAKGQRLKGSTGPIK